MVCIMSVMTVCAGKKQLFNDAISRGVDAKGFYCIDNSKGEKVPMYDMRVYVARQNYHPEMGETDQKGRLIKLYFISDQDFDAYVHYALSKEKKDLKQLKSKGKVILFEVRRNFFGTIIGCQMSTLRDAQWTGSVVDGKIHGKGSGLIYDQSSREYIFFEGEFDNGCPVSKTVMRYHKSEPYDCDISIIQHKFREEKASAPTPKDYADNLPWSKYPQDAKDCLNKRLANVYAHASEWLEKTRLEALKVNMSNYKTFKYTKDVEEFYKVYTKLKYDPQHILQKAEEIQDFYDILEDMKMNINNVVGFSLLWKDCTPAEKKQIVDEGIAKSKKWQKQGTCGLSKFYTMAIADLSKKSKELGNRADALEKASREANERERKETEIANNMSWVKPDKEGSWEQVNGIFGVIEDEYKKYVLWNDKHMNGEYKSIYINMYTGKTLRPGPAYGFGTGVLFDNYNDAVAAAYVYLKTGYKRTVGGH